MKSDAEKIMVDKKTNYFYLKRGVARTPVGSEVEIVTCNQGLVTSAGVMKGTQANGLRSMTGQFIAFSYDPDDLMLFALEHGYELPGDTFLELKETLGSPEPSEAQNAREAKGEARGGQKV